MPRKKRAPQGAKSASTVGASTLALEFYAGRYPEIVEQQFDGAANFDERDAAFVIGALTFVGRIEEAQLCFDGLRLRETKPAARTVAAAHFFLGVAYARAGDFESARRYLVENARSRARDRDQWLVALVFQGLACHRYFTGHYRAAARHALRALRAAHVARFGYAQMLANDLRGHALAQLGQFRAGIGLLEQAKKSSERLAFGMNAYAIECSIANYVAESVARPEALERIEGLLARRSHDSYSKRALLAGSATQLALRGRCSSALAALSEADADALAQGTRRAKLTNVVARLHVLRWSHGPKACDMLLEQARELVDEGDVALRAELLSFDSYIARGLGDAERHDRAVADLRQLAQSTEHHRAQAALEQLGISVPRQRAFPEDEVTPLLRAVTTQDRAILPRLLALGLLGPIPELLGLQPARRIIVLATENAVLLEDHGDLQIKPSPPRWFAVLVRLLAAGVASKELLVASLWGLRSYRPERHDSLIRTTIHRFRALLAPHGDWIFVADSGGYGCSAPIVFFGSNPESGEVSDIETPLAEGEAPQPIAPSATQAPIVETVSSRVLTLLQNGEPNSVQQIARALGISESTALRALRALVASRRVKRSGFARRTRYQARIA